MNIALLGVSHWHAAMHADAVRHAGATIGGVWDWDPDCADRFAAAQDAVALTSLDAVLARGPDLVVVMGHPARVPSLAETVMLAGLPMLLEKPSASDTATLEDIAHRVQQTNLFVAVPLANRLSPALADLTAPVAHAHFRIVNGPPQRYRDDGVGWVLDPAIGGGGALRNLGIHGIDCALSLAQGPLRIISASVARRMHTSELVEDHALVVLADAADALFTIEAGYTAPNMSAGGDFEWRTATPGRYCIDRGAQVTTLQNDGERQLPPLLPAHRYRAFMADTLARLDSGRPPMVTLDDYVAAMRLIDAIYERAAS
ncbi:MAG: Gfo/Idh/MocA family oxidoreductase [Devosia marina]|jgi:predicted dehydrogenase|uniref:Gfo/Idh/MocA family protein n=1 Tax=Devosia marina TaxID=2683198 RepID=UPI0032EBDE9E